MSLRAPVPPLLRRLSSDEYRPLPWRLADREALARFGDAAGERALGSYSRRRPTWRTGGHGTGVALRAIDGAGGGFYTLPAEAEVDAATADACFNGGEGSAVIDVQTHLVNPARFDGPGPPHSPGSSR